MKSDRNLQNNASMSSGAANTENDSMLFGEQKSPGSLLGSSIRSNQVESFDIASESSVTGENSGWRLGMPWFANNNHNRTKNTRANEVHKYYGGIMKSTAESQVSPSSSTSNSSRHFRPFRKNAKRVSPSKDGKRNENNHNIIDTYDKYSNKNGRETKSNSKTNDDASVPIARTKSNTADSIADFDDSEWTPPDSSYGAACPVCGCIPKRVRQMIEMTLIAAMVFGLIYLVVTTSMKIADARSVNDNSDNYSNNNYNRTGSSSAASNNYITDDDHYVEKSYSNYDDDGGNGDDATFMDDNYIGDDNGDNYNVNDDANDKYGYSQSYNYNNNGNGYQNYNNYNQNQGYYQSNDDYNGRRRRLRSSLKRLHVHGRRDVMSI